MTDGRIVYASPTKPLRRDRALGSAAAACGAAERRRPDVATQIHAFDISNPSKTTYLGSGTVPGYLLNQWSLSEFQGVLRVVSTDSPAWWGAGGSGQPVVSDDPASARRHARQVGQVGGLGQGDRVYAVRFIGDTGYVVTFQQVDPLYTRRPLRPGAPEGCSASYDLPATRPTCIRSATTCCSGSARTSARTTSRRHAGLALRRLRPEAPDAARAASLGQGWSAAEADHHAFLYWPATGLVVVPFGQQAVAMQVSRAAASASSAAIVQTDAKRRTLPQIERSVVVGTRL